MKDVDMKLMQLTGLLMRHGHMDRALQASNIGFNSSGGVATNACTPCRHKCGFFTKGAAKPMKTLSSKA